MRVSRVFQGKKMAEKVVEISVNLTDSEATQIYIFLKHLMHNQICQNVHGDEEAEHVATGFDKLRQALVWAGYEKR